MIQFIYVLARSACVCVFRPRKPLAIVAIILSVSASVYAEETLYVATGTGGVAGNLYIVNPTTAAATSVSALAQGGFDNIGLTGLAFHPPSGVLYGTTSPFTDVFGNRFSAATVTINLASPDQSIVHNDLNTTIEDIAFRSNSVLYGFESVSPFRLFTITLDNSPVAIGNSGLSSAKGGGLAFNGAGTLYLAATGDHATATLDTLNVTTGARTNGPVLSGGPFNSTDSNITALAVNSAGTLFGVDSDPSTFPATAKLIKINPVTGAITAVGTLPDDTDALAFSPAILPIAAQQFDTSIHAGRVGTQAEIVFNRLPHSTTALVSIDVSSSVPEDLKVALFSRQGDPFNNPTFTLISMLWDHETFGLGQPVPRINAVLPSSTAAEPDTNPPVYTYVVRAFDDVPKRPDPNSTPTGVLHSVTLTLDPPNSPGHTNPTVNIFAGSAAQPVALPSQINFGDPLTIVATATGNPSNVTIDRLTVKVNEVTDPDHPENDHISGVGPRMYTTNDVAGTAAGATLTFTPGELLLGNNHSPILPPGTYHIDATAYDSGGFSTHVQKTLTVARLFGFGGLTITRTINDDSDCPQTVCNFSTGDVLLPCNTAHFDAMLNLINNTNSASGSLRVRVFEVPSAAYEDQDDPPTLPPVTELPPPPQVQPNPSPHQVTISTVNPLPAHSNEQVHVVGVAHKPEQGDCFVTTGIGYQIYAKLEEFIGGQWTPIDSIKVTEGQWPVIGGFAGPGGGVNNPRDGLPPGSDPLVYSDLTLSGPNPDSVAAGQQKSYTATAVLTNTTTSQNTDVTSQAQWSNAPGGVFQAPNTSGQVSISATFAVGGLTKTATKMINVTGGSTPTPTPSATASPTPTPTPTPTPVMTLSPTTSSIGKTGSATITVTANTINPSQPVVVHYALSGNAILGSDYTLSGTPNQFIIPPNQSSNSITLTATTMKTKGREKAIMTLTPGSDYSFPKKGKRVKPPKTTITISNK